MPLPLSPAGRRYGAKRDTADHRDLGMASFEAARSAVAELPPVMDLEPWCGPVRDQGPLGSCTAYAGCGMREFLYRKYNTLEKHRDVPLDQAIFSPMYLYYRERYHENTLPQDAGAQIRSIPWTLNHFGVCLESEDTYRPLSFDISPTPDQTAEAYNYHAGAYHRISTVHDMKTCLSSGYVFVMGIAVYESFESDSVARTGLVPIPKNGDAYLGGHAVLVIGYNDTVQCPGAALGAFKVRNSWSRDWGQEGNFYYSYTAAADQNLTMDAWVQHLSGPWR